MADQQRRQGYGSRRGQFRGGNPRPRMPAGPDTHQFAVPPPVGMPPRYPAPFMNPDPAKSQGQTVREETTTTIIEGGKTVTKTVVTIKNDTSHGTDLENVGFSPNVHHQQNAAYPPNVPLPSLLGDYQHGLHSPPPIIDQRPPNQYYPNENRATSDRQPAYGGRGGNRPPRSDIFRGKPCWDNSRGHARPDSSRGYLRGGRGRNSRPPNRGHRQQHGSLDRDRNAFLHGSAPNLTNLSVADIAIEDDSDEESRVNKEDVKSDEESVTKVVSKKKQRKPKKNKKDKSSTAEDMDGGEASLADVLSGLDDIGGRVTGGNTADTDEAREKNVSKKARKKKAATKLLEEQTADTKDDNMEGQARKTSESEDVSDLPPGPAVHAVFNFIVKQMDGKGSPDEIQKKSGLFPSTYSPDMVDKWFRRFDKRFKSIIRDDCVCSVLAYDRELNYCLDYYSRRGCKKDICQRYHLCKDYLGGLCKYGTKCNRSHDFFDTSSENLSITTRLGYAKRFTNDHMLSLMQCRYPKVCHEWNQDRSCTGTDCNQLHMCERFLVGRCDEEDDCEYGHTRLSDHNTPIVEAYRMAHWNDVNFRRIIYITRTFSGGGSEDQTRVGDNVDETEHDIVEDETDTLTTTSGRNVPDVSKADGIAYLCDQFLIDKCSNVECGGYHNEKFRLPYLWQVKLGNQWQDCAQQGEIEKEYCALAEKSEPFYIHLSELVDISELVVLEFGPVLRARLLNDDTEAGARRLSTKSYKEKGAASARYATQWRWFMAEDGGTAKLFSPDSLQHTLESKYLAGQSEYQFINPGLPHIDFTAMCYVNGGKYSQVYRRPLLVTASDIAEKKRASILNPDASLKVPLPRDWVTWDTSHEAELVKLTLTSPEFIEAEEDFFRHLKRDRFMVQGIFRVQNYTLWAPFVSKEQSMLAGLKRAHRPASELNKRYLYHGTETFEAVKGICRSNIDPRRSGKNDTKFGEGAYFALEARYANQYTRAPDRFVFRVSVLVGQYCQGQREYRMPPEIPGTDREYDSCVDDMIAPMRFVLFDRNQYYPSYLIWYRDAQT